MVDAARATTRRRSSSGRISASGCRVERKAERRVIGHHIFAQRRRTQRDASFADRRIGENRQRQFRAGAVPARAMTMAAQALQRTGIGKARAFGCADARAAGHVGDVREWRCVARIDETRGEIFGQTAF